MAIIGESEQGDAYAAETGGVAAVSWAPSQYSQIAAKYGAGPIADAARLAFNASNDPDITGGAQLLITLKTNQSVKSQLVLPTAYGTEGRYRWKRFDRNDRDFWRSSHHDIDR
jgi:hypothetical protein